MYSITCTVLCEFGRGLNNAFCSDSIEYCCGYERASATPTSTHPIER
eukprot:COSAG06_NODE_56909_length_282_cov_1.267760_1_plen_46_part_10